MKIVLKSLTVMRGGKLVINNLTAEMDGPGLYQIIGPNGSGKTTLLLTILGFIKPISGTVNIIIDKSGRGPVISYMPQSFNIPRDAPLTVYEFVKNYYDLIKPWPKRLLWKNAGEDERVIKVLELVKIPRDLWHEKLRNLSSGMLQRAFLARTLVSDAPLLLLDEPLSNIDPEGRVHIAELLGALSREKLIVVTSHDPVLLLKYTKKVLLLGFGCYVYGNAEETLNYEVLSKLYKKCAIELEKHVHIADWH